MLTTTTSTVQAVILSRIIAVAWFLGDVSVDVEVDHRGVWRWSSGEVHPTDMRHDTVVTVSLDLSGSDKNAGNHFELDFERYTDEFCFSFTSLPTLPISLRHESAWFLPDSKDMT